MAGSTDKSLSRLELAFALIVVFASFGVFATSVGGGFVYDDNRQIVRNVLIQEPSLYRKALVSDVWAFKGDGSIAASNYWRPTFTAWSILSFRIFGMEPFGWHLSNLLLHSLICVLAFLFLRRLEFSAFTAFAAAMIFAVHPVHAESVAWISGSPDLLFSLFFLVSLWFAKNWAEKRHRTDLIISLASYALALGAKETALFCLPVFWLVIRSTGEVEEVTPSRNTALRAMVPFVLVAGLYFVLRWVIIGGLSKPVERSTDALSALLSVPEVFAFYIKQILYPNPLSVNYPLRPVASIGLWNVVFPMAVCTAVIAGILYAVRKQKTGWLGAALFLLPIIPVLNTAIFPKDQIVHDRYLYLPLLGVLVLIIPALERLFAKLLPARSGIALVSASLAISVVLSALTIRYIPVWDSDLALWSNAVKVDTHSATSFSQYGSALETAEEYREAVRAYNSSLDIEANAYAYLGKARSNIRLEKYEEATWDLKTVTEMPSEQVNAYTLYQAYEALAISTSSAGRLMEAEAALREATERLPIYRAALASKLAVVLYQDKRQSEALLVLESARKQAVVELLPESKTVLFRLGMLYAQMGLKEKANDSLEEFLKLTATFGDKDTLADRAAAAEALKRMR